MSARYASKTEVPVARSKEHIEAMLRRYGADSFAYGSDDETGLIVVGFRMHGRYVRFRVPVPKPNERRFTHTATGKVRTKPQVETAYEQALRSLWRAIHIVITAKLESVELGIESFDAAFMSQIMLPSGATVGEFLEPQIVAAYERGEMPALLPGLSWGDVPALGPGR